MSFSRAVSLGALLISSSSGAGGSSVFESLEPFGSVEGPRIQRDQGGLSAIEQNQALSSNPISTLFFSGKKAYQRQEGAYVVATEGISAGLEWSPRGETLQVISLHRSKDGDRTLGYAQVNYYGRDEKRVTAHFKTPALVISSSLDERRFSDHIIQATLLSGNVGLVEFTARKPKGDAGYPTLTDDGTNAVLKIDTKTGRTLGSWVLSDGDQLLVDKNASVVGEKKAYIFHRETSGETFKCALYDVLSGQKIELRDNTGVIGILPDGSILLSQPSDTSTGDNRKREKVVYKDGVLGSYVPTEFPVTRIDEKPQIELLLQGSRAYLSSKLPPERPSLPSKLDLGFADKGILAPHVQKNTQFTVALFLSGIVAVKTVNEVDLAQAVKAFEEATELASSEKRAGVMADALDKITDSGTDLSKMSDQEIRDLIKGTADLSSLGPGADLFKGGVQIEREGSDVILSFRTGSGHTFKIVPGGYEIIPPSI